MSFLLTVISIYWITDDESQAIYWIGSYVAPTTSDSPYRWTSIRDKETANKIKGLLCTGITTSGENNNNVDFTIIIGTDY